MLVDPSFGCRIAGITGWSVYRHSADDGDVASLLVIAKAYGTGGPDMPVNRLQAIEYYHRVTQSKVATDAQKTEARTETEKLEKRR
jgi:hypothetical protein